MLESIDDPAGSPLLKPFYKRTFGDKLAFGKDGRWVEVLRENEVAFTGFPVENFRHVFLSLLLLLSQLGRNVSLWPAQVTRKKFSRVKASRYSLLLDVLLGL